MSAGSVRGFLAEFRKRSIAAGRPFECFCPMAGYSYHSTEALAWQAGRRRSNKLVRDRGGLPDGMSGPVPSVVDLRTEGKS